MFSSNGSSVAAAHPEFGWFEWVDHNFCTIQRAFVPFLNQLRCPAENSDINFNRARILIFQKLPVALPSIVLSRGGDDGL
jgi:hypothetical protein